MNPACEFDLPTHNLVASRADQQIWFGTTKYGKRATDFKHSQRATKAIDEKVSKFYNHDTKLGAYDSTKRKRGESDKPNVKKGNIKRIQSNI